MDDIALLGSTQRSICDLTAILENKASKIGLRISVAKSKVMRIGYARKLRYLLAIARFMNGDSGWKVPP